MSLGNFLTIPKADGSSRVLHIPSQNLLKIQKRIIRHILSFLAPSPAPLGFLEGAYLTPLLPIQKLSGSSQWIARTRSGLSLTRIYTSTCVLLDGQVGGVEGLTNTAGSLDTQLASSQSS